MNLLDPAPDLANAYKAAGDPGRLRILALLGQGERCVCHLHAALGAPQPTVSRHLAVLRAAGLVVARREGAWVYYRLTSRAEVLFAPGFVQWRADALLAPAPAAVPACP